MPLAVLAADDIDEWEPTAIAPPRLVVSDASPAIRRGTAGSRHRVRRVRARPAAGPRRRCSMWPNAESP